VKVETAPSDGTLVVVVVLAAKQEHALDNLEAESEQAVAKAGRPAVEVCTAFVYVEQKEEAATELRSSARRQLSALQPDTCAETNGSNEAATSNKA